MLENQWIEILSRSATGNSPQHICQRGRTEKNVSVRWKVNYWRNWKSNTGRNHEGEPLQDFKVETTRKRITRKSTRTARMRGWGLYWFLPDNRCTGGKTWSTCGSIREPCLALRRYIPFENKELIDNRTNFPRLYRRRVDQTRRLVRYTLSRAIVVFDSACIQEYHISNGLVLDAMETKCPNVRQCCWSFWHDRETDQIPCAVHDHELSTVGITKFDIAGVEEWNVSSGTLYTCTYSFFALWRQYRQVHVCRGRSSFNRDRVDHRWFFLYWIAWLKRSPRLTAEKHEPTRADGQYRICDREPVELVRASPVNVTGVASKPPINRL